MHFLQITANFLQFSSLFFFYLEFFKLAIKQINEIRRKLDMKNRVKKGKKLKINHQRKISQFNIIN